jgi:hypothetical protein
MDALLAIPEVALEWNVDTPDNFTFFLGLAVSALWIGSRTYGVLTDVQ